MRVTTSLGADSGKELTAARLSRIAGGNQVIIEEEVPGEPWPALTIWQRVKCTPSQLAGVFWDSELDVKYLPGCIGARIISRPRPSLQETKFTLKMPFFLPEEVYVSRIELLPPSQGMPGSYKITWNVVESLYAKSCDGEIEIRPHEGMTLIRYRNFMIPRSRMAGILRGPGMSRVVESVRALVGQVEREVRESPALLERQQKELQRALGH